MVPISSSLEPERSVGAGKAVEIGTATATVPAVKVLVAFAVRTAEEIVAAVAAAETELQRKLPKLRSLPIVAFFFCSKQCQSKPVKQSVNSAENYHTHRYWS